MKRKDAMEYANQKTGWRLPTKDELADLVDKNYKPMIDNVVFPRTKECLYWSSSPYAGNSYNVWSVDFLNGFVYYSNRYYGYGAVRLVRDGGEL